MIGSWLVKNNDKTRSLTITTPYETFVFWKTEIDRVECSSSIGAFLVFFNSFSYTEVCFLYSIQELCPLHIASYYVIAVQKIIHFSKFNSYAAARAALIIWSSNIHLMLLSAGTTLFHLIRLLYYYHQLFIDIKRWNMWVLCIRLKVQRSTKPGFSLVKHQWKN